ncbi:hypothetical protein AB6884_03545 [Carnobacterium maltaromaticum]|uniref:hypothetical protein n=1 Tax=Carnobacterium maltaromaticum TaxID=2751 RepID=UPI0039BE18ED
MKEAEFRVWNEHKKYMHKIVMFDVNSAVRTAVFTNKEKGESFISAAFDEEYTLFKDSAESIFNIANIVQMNPVEVIE